MTRYFQPRFSCGVGVIVALIGMWLLGCAGLFLLHSYDHPWFLALGGYDAGTLGQIGCFFLLRFLAQIPALTFAVMIVSMSDVRHPIRTAFWIALGLHLLLIGVRAARWPWSSFPALDQSIPVLAECASLVLIVGYTVLLTWLVLIYDERKRRLSK